MRNKTVSALVLVAACGVAAQAMGAPASPPAQQAAPADEALVDEQLTKELELIDKMNKVHSRAPVDYGYGPGKKPPPSKPGASADGGRVGAAAIAVAPAGDKAAQVKGVFGPVLPWPIIAIHAVLLPDGRVLSYGTNQKGQQGAALVYDVWNPAEGTEVSSHMVLPNTTATDIFCSGQSVISATGEVLITGGDLTINGKRGYSNNQTTIFNPETNDIRSGEAMAYPRWYPSLISMPNGDFVILGGRLTKDKICPGGETLACQNQYASTPEVYNQTSGWRTLSGAKSDTLFGKDWYYPRAYRAPNGRVFLLRYNGETYFLDASGNGNWLRQSAKIPGSTMMLPSVMYAPGKILSLRNTPQVHTVDINGAAPTIKRVSDLQRDWGWATMTVMADGKVLVNGGRGQAVDTYGQVQYANYIAQIWNPATGTWTAGDQAAKARLYHSSALLLPDATVLTAGGGAPGPVANLNAEIYYPPYLYAKDGSGRPAERPTIVDAAATARVGRTLAVTLGEGTTASRVTMVRAGSVTHSYDSDQRFFAPAFTQQGSSLSVTLPSNVNVVLPGYYMLFVFDTASVPSVAHMIWVTA